MKQFFKFAFASMLGMILTLFIFFLIVVGSIGVLINSKEQPVNVKDNSVLRLNLNFPITERASSDPLENIDIGPISGQKKLGLNQILEAIEAAKEDDKIKGIYLEAGYISTGMATLEQIRNALLDFKKSGKFIMAYSEVYSQSAYYLASAASKIYLNPAGLMEIKGFSTLTPFFKGALDKLNIEAQIIKVGTYKSAVEPFILEGMSDANRLQMNALVNSLYDNFANKVATSRKLELDSVYAIANQLKCRSAEDAVKLKLIDGLRYKDEVIKELKSLTKTDDDDDIPTVGIEDYVKGIDKKSSASDRIAVVYANGDITGGEGDEETIGSETISRAIRDARENDKVKAVVLRINSPGGSALASDVIWREVLLAKKVKPVIVSMGDYAASGGYYIACAADSIFAEPNTITGSIGVFAIIPNFKNFLDNKLGIKFDGVKTGEFGDIGNVMRPMTAAEKMIFQAEVNRTYSDFTKRVADGRNLTTSYVDSIGQGRVWTGTQAVKNGLVDRIGGIDDAIKSAAKKAKLKDYKLVAYPEQKSGLMAILDNSKDDLKSYFVKEELGESYTYYQQLKETVRMKGVQTRLPFLIEVE